MVVKSFDQIFEESIHSKQPGERLTDNIAVPMTTEYKQKYRKIQSEDREFCRTIRALIINAIDRKIQAS